LTSSLTIHELSFYSPARFRRWTTRISFHPSPFNRVAFRLANRGRSDLNAGRGCSRFLYFCFGGREGAEPRRMRIAIVTWNRRWVGGVETYLGAVVPALAAAGADIALWCEVARPIDRDPIPLPATTSVICAEAGGLAAAVADLRAWAPDVLYAHGLRDPEAERQVLGVAPAAFLAHNYHGTCISGAKTFKRPAVVPCRRRFGWPCLVQYFPRRCGGWSPVSMVREFRRQRVRLGLLRQSRAVLTLSSHMREEYARHGLGASRVFEVPGEPRREASGLAGGAPARREGDACACCLPAAWTAQGRGLSDRRAADSGARSASRCRSPSPVTVRGGRTGNGAPLPPAPRAICRCGSGSPAGSTGRGWPTRSTSRICWCCRACGPSPSA
jgi:hypothetical protein